MKIAIIGSKGIPATFGGVEKHTEELAIGLVKRGHDVTVYSREWYTKYTENEYKGVKIKNLRSIKTKNLDTISHVFLASIDASLNDFDVIHYQGVGPSLLSFIPKLLSPKTKVVTTFHCEDFKHEKWGAFAKFMLKLGEKAALWFPHKTITVSKLLKYKVENFYDKKAEYIPNGVSIKNDLKISKYSSILKKFNIENGKYIVAITRLIRHKGVHLLIDAYKNLSEELKNQYKLVIVGGTTFGDSYEDELKKMIKDEKRIVMTGMQSGKNLEDLFLGAKLFVHASQAEGLPIIVLEAMNYEKSILVSDIAEHTEVVGSDRGFTFKNGNIKDLKNKIEFLLDDNNKDIVNKAIINAKKAVEKEYDWEKVIDQTEALYKDLLDNKKADSNIRVYKKRVS